MFSVQIDGEPSDLDINDNFTVRWTYAGYDYNNNDLDALFPRVMLLDRTTKDYGGPSTAAPYTYRFASGGVGYEVTALGSGSVDIRFLSLSTFLNFTLFLSI